MGRFISLIHLDLQKFVERGERYKKGKGPRPLPRRPFRPTLEPTD